MDEHTQRELDRHMALLAEGRRSAFSLVFRQLQPVLHRFAERLLGAGPDADDVTQQALEKIFERAAEYDSRRPALPWAFAITGWECATLRKKRTRSREDSVEARDRTSDAPSPEADFVQRDLERALEQTMAELSPADRNVLQVAFFETWNAEGDAMSPTTFRKRKERAVKRLRDTWRKLHDV